uniref:HhH-GPD domain-containing protein n=1 Tax=Alexandrium monilatum TaxID=311494 RepID=A0A7S4Q756_9DINO
MSVTRRRPVPGVVAAGLVRLFAPPKRCRVGASGEFVVADSDSEREVEVSPADAGPPPMCTSQTEVQSLSCNLRASGRGQAPDGWARPLRERPASENEPVAFESEPDVQHEVALGADVRLEVPQAGHPAADFSSSDSECVVVDDVSPIQGHRGQQHAGSRGTAQAEADDWVQEPVVAAADGLFDEFKFDQPAGRCPGPRMPHLQVRGCRSRLPRCGSLTPPPELARHVAWPRRAAKARCRTAEGGEEDLASAPSELRLQVLQKWRDMAGSAPSHRALRLQLLVAAILHPKTSEAIVRGSMGKLLVWGEAHQDPPRPRGLGAELLAATEPRTLEELWEGLHWHKVKAARVVAAAAALEARWGGTVPSLKEELITLPGIGPKLANILSFVLDGLAPDRPTSSQPVEASPSAAPEDE